MSGILKHASVAQPTTELCSINVYHGAVYCEMSDSNFRTPKIMP